MVAKQSPELLLRQEEEEKMDTAEEKLLPKLCASEPRLLSTGLLRCGDVTSTKPNKIYLTESIDCKSNLESVLNVARLNADEVVWRRAGRGDLLYRHTLLHKQSWASPLIISYLYSYFIYKQSWTRPFTISYLYSLISYINSWTRPLTISYLYSLI